MSDSIRTVPFESCCLALSTLIQNYKSVSLYHISIRTDGYQWSQGFTSILTIALLSRGLLKKKMVEQTI